jgi:small-conductance mechanosensitive channel
MKKIKFSYSDQSLRILTNIWTFVALFLFSIDFFSGNKYNSQASAVAVIYLAILALYAGTKEFDRWYHYHKSLHIGEYFVVIWTALVLIMVMLAPFSKGAYKLPGELVATYIAVVGILILTQRSKALHRESHTKKK